MTRLLWFRNDLDNSSPFGQPVVRPQPKEKSCSGTRLRMMKRIYSIHLLHDPFGHLLASRRSKVHNTAHVLQTTGKRTTESILAQNDGRTLILSRNARHFLWNIPV